VPDGPFKEEKVSVVESGAKTLVFGFEMQFCLVRAVGSWRNAGLVLMATKTKWHIMVKNGTFSNAMDRGRSGNNRVLFS
jgi:hypothetical protein